MNSADIAQALARQPFNYRRFVVVENVSWGMLPWEADLLALSQSGYLYEIEIKISIADLKRDRSKRKWTPAFQAYAGSMLRGMWFAMPKTVWEHKDAADAVPEKAGVIVVSDDKRAAIVRQCKPDASAHKLSERERFQLARLGTMRYWTKKVA